MIFKRIDDQTVNCIITPDDMKNHGLKIDDLFEKKEEAMEFLHMVINEARRRVNFKPTGAVTSMQMSVLPDRSISLIISEQSSAQFEMLLKKLQEKLGITIPEKIRKQLEGMSDDERIDRLKEYAARIQLGTETGEKSEAAVGEEHPAKEYLYSFFSFSNVVQCCRFIAEESRICPEAELYRHGDIFYLILHNEGASEEQFNKIALSLNEFGSMITAKDGVIAHIRETDIPVIHENTVRVLAEL